ncbi:deoxyribose-phosphate aldolase [Parabacteroides sp. PF5-6]|uniref:deoxyribose-phosphate aldolase n=1 Tax=Parabacteroides sp. PF5-6 TaxID=1742403 RepID=UPI0024070B1B|nr:deoxyribose-phosphate aldolase [Parabacteroides sp. PF5-6]MDF9831717.1 deoxyribose-phosphate aldolase [Parabacteroides sp. PF5-6]
MEQVVANLSVKDLAGMIDHTFLKPYGTAADIEKLCAEADQYGFAMVAINPAEVTTCASLLKSSAVRVGAAIGFPLGQTTTECKAFETRDSIEKGATEIDTVINIRALQKGQLDIVKREIEDMVSICRPAGVICKVILETCYLTDEEKETVCRIAKEAGVDFVKTSTGFGTSGATVHDIALMRRVVGPDLGVKASGGVRDLESALAMIKAGATRIGTSSGVAIVEAYMKMKEGK